MKEIIIKSTKKEEIIDITKKVKECIDKEEGICIVYVPHATCGIIINENYDPNVMTDILELLDKQIPQGKWKHDKIDGNGAAHIKSAIIGPSETIIVKEKKLLLGQWQNIMLCDFDGPRERKIYVEVK